MSMVFFFLEIDEYGSILSDRQMPLIDIYNRYVSQLMFFWRKMHFKHNFKIEAIFQTQNECVRYHIIDNRLDR